MVYIGKVLYYNIIPTFVLIFFIKNIQNPWEKYVCYRFSSINICVCVSSWQCVMVAARATADTTSPDIYPIYNWTILGIYLIIYFQAIPIGVILIIKPTKQSGSDWRKDQEHPGLDYYRSKFFFFKFLSKIFSML